MPFKPYISPGSKKILATNCAPPPIIDRLLADAYSRDKRLNEKRKQRQEKALSGMFTPRTCPRSGKIIEKVDAEGIYKMDFLQRQQYLAAMKRQEDEERRKAAREEDEAVAAKVAKKKRRLPHADCGRLHQW